MIIVPRGAIQMVASAMTDALMSATKPDGSQLILDTIDPQKLQDIALGALTMTAGDVVWPSGKEVEVHVDDRPRWLKMRYDRR